MPPSVPRWESGIRDAIQNEPATVKSARLRHYNDTAGSKVSWINARDSDGKVVWAYSHWLTEQRAQAGAAHKGGEGAPRATDAAGSGNRVSDAEAGELLARLQKQAVQDPSDVERFWRWLTAS